MTLAEETAARENLPVVTLTTFECVHVATGHPMIVRTLQGDQVLVRLYTPEELMAANRQAIERYPDGPPPMTHAQAAELTKPLSA